MRPGKVRELAVNSLKRTTAAPNLPTLDSMFSGYKSANWYAMFVPASAPSAAATQIKRAITLCHTQQNS